VTGGGFSYTTVAGQSATFTGSDQLQYDLEQLPPQDDFDQWCFTRDTNEDQADSANYVSREMTGYEDLDESGTWSYEAGYGEVWAPSAVAVGWAPYRFGHWVWVSPWGWTWVEDEPWGFAPFHYGRWAFGGTRWFWVPGPVVVRPIWAPALVAFVGGGPGFHFSAGVGVGWFPLGPGEVYVPSYRVSRNYVNNVNVTNTTVNITKVTNVYNTVIVNKTTVNNITYVNQRTNGVTVVSHDAFVNARPVAQNVMKVSPQEIAAAPVSHVVSAEPLKTSVIGAGHPVTAKPPAAVLSRPVVAVKTPPPPPKAITQQQVEAGGHLNQQLLVHSAGAAKPAQMSPGAANHPEASAPGKPAPQPAPGNAQVKPMLKPQPRVYEQQGPSEPESRPAAQQPENHNAEPNRPAQPENQASRPQQPAPQTHPLVRQAPPVQERTPQQEQQQAQKFNQWQQQRPAPAAKPAPQPKPAPPPKPEPAPKK
jgi:hypothetical protein